MQFYNWQEEEQLLSDRMRRRNEKHRNKQDCSLLNCEQTIKYIVQEYILKDPSWLLEPVQTTSNCQTTVHHEPDGILSQSSMNHSQITEMADNQKHYL